MNNDEIAPKQPETTFDTAYANNSIIEPSAWDIKIIFGQLEQHTGTARVDWHTAVTLPWAQAKILSYFLMANIAVQEHVNGRISIPANVLPPKPEAPSGEFENNPDAVAIYNIFSQLHSQIFG